MKPTYRNTMRTLLAAMIILASAAPLWAQDEMLELQTLNLENQEMPPLFPDSALGMPIPPDDSWPNGGYVIGNQPPILALNIQAVPEPSAFALGGLAWGLIALVKRSSKKLQ